MRTILGLFFAAWGIVVIASPALAQPTSLDRFEREADRPAVSEPDRTSPAQAAKDDDDDTWVGSLILSALELGLMVPKAILSNAIDLGTPDEGLFAARIGYGADNGPVSHIHADARANILGGIGASIGMISYREKVGAATDHLEFYNGDLRYQFGSFRNGIGVEVGGRWMTAGARSRSGLDAALTGDFSPIDQVHLDAGWRVSRLSATTFRELTVGAAFVFQGFEARVGYRNLDNGVSHLEGPEFGIGYSF